MIRYRSYFGHLIHYPCLLLWSISDQRCFQWLALKVEGTGYDASYLQTPPWRVKTYPLILPLLGASPWSTESTSLRSPRRKDGEVGGWGWSAPCPASQHAVSSRLRHPNKRSVYSVTQHPPTNEEQLQKGEQLGHSPGHGCDPRTGAGWAPSLPFTGPLASGGFLDSSSCLGQFLSPPRDAFSYNLTSLQVGRGKSRPGSLFCP